MKDITFDSVEARVWICPVCKARHIGGIHEFDPATYDFFNLHGWWHQTTPSAPPVGFVRPKKQIEGDGNAKGIL